MKQENGKRPLIPPLLVTIFGLIMILFYVGIGCVLIFTNFFFWMGYYWRIALGVLLIVYGIWRAIRQFKSIDSSI